MSHDDALPAEESHRDQNQILSSLHNLTQEFLVGRRDSSAKS